MRTLACGLMAACLVALTGCGITGTWRTNTVEPSSAREKFELGSVTLNSDHTYVAEAQYSGKTAKREGTWTFDHGKLTFKGKDGHERTYNAELIDMGSRLRVETESHGSKVVAIMKRE
ncbi:MAG: hypothetical protein CHACPFDD_02518 [Phycisphaerae bacterium]|nr:hypothetical protein [Phycisphaerae bacterium]